MATQYAFGQIVTSGLVLSLDAADKNSYVSGSTVWNDLSGNGNGGAILGPTYNSSNGGALFFPTTANAYVSGSSPNLPSGNSAFTKSAWIQSGYKGNSSTGHPNIISWGNNLSNNKNGLSLQTDASNNPQILHWFFANDYSCSINDITNTWANITVTYNPPTLVFYINAVSQSTQTVTGTPNVVGTTQLEIGRFGTPTNYNFSGSIANVQIYNRALSQTEVLQNYNAQKSRYGL
jgi:hypothetical protein